jgi:hypothetical protein
MTNTPTNAPIKNVRKRGSHRRRIRATARARVEDIEEAIRSASTLPWGERWDNAETSGTEKGEEGRCMSSMWRTEVRQVDNVRIYVNCVIVDKSDEEKRGWSVGGVAMVEWRAGACSGDVALQRWEFIGASVAVWWPAPTRAETSKLCRFLWTRPQCAEYNGRLIFPRMKVFLGDLLGCASLRG